MRGLQKRNERERKIRRKGREFRIDDLKLLKLWSLGEALLGPDLVEPPLHAGWF